MGTGSQTLAWVFTRLLHLNEEAATFRQWGFHAGEAARRVLELLCCRFVPGDNAVLQVSHAGSLREALEGLPPAERGLGYEGAGMACALLDLVAGGFRLPKLLVGPGLPHRYLVLVGAGWAMARLRLRRRSWQVLPPILRWLANEGRCFPDGFFRPGRTIAAGHRPIVRPRPVSATKVWDAVSSSPAGATWTT